METGVTWCTIESNWHESCFGTEVPAGLPIWQRPVRASPAPARSLKIYSLAGALARCLAGTDRPRAFAVETGLRRPSYPPYERVSGRTPPKTVFLAGNLSPISSARKLATRPEPITYDLYTGVQIGKVSGPLGVRGQESGARSQEPGVRSQEPGGQKPGGQETRIRMRGAHQVCSAHQQGICRPETRNSELGTRNQPRIRRLTSPSAT